MDDIDQKIRDIVATTVATVAPERVILFGSYARGDAGPDSDVDLLVVAGGPLIPVGQRQDELRRIRRALRGLRIPVDILLYAPEEIDAWRDSPNHVQAVEKLLKAWLAPAVPRFPASMTYLRLLLQLVAVVASGGPAEFQDLKDFTDYRVQFLYDALSALGLLDRVVRRSG